MIRRRFPGILACFLLLSIPGSTACRHRPAPREILPGEIYVSGQPDPERLHEMIAALDLRSVLNLRSENRARFSEEIELCRQSDVDYFAVALPLDDWTPRPALARIVKILENAPRPLLVHCRNGVDRSGLVAAVAILLSDRRLPEAWKQMPPLSRRRALHGDRPLARVLIDYGDFLAGTESSGKVFRNWVETRYCPAPWAAEIELEETPPAVLGAGATVEFHVRVKNTGTAAWKVGEAGPILGLRLFPAEVPVGRFHFIDCGRSPLPKTEVEAGETLRWTASFRLPRQEGKYLVGVDLLREHEHWFSEMGRPIRLYPVRLTSP